MERRVAYHIAVINGVVRIPVTTSVYDMVDRRTEVNHPASGTTSFTYDPLGNVLTKQTANMAEEGKMITYTYDYHRLTGINYPDHPENNVKYYYGGRNASYNRIGRLMMREDGTGAIEYFYGKMGEVTKTRRTLIVPNQAIATYVTQWTYDSHNRLIEMIYPDEEKVTYSYNLGGLLEKVRGEKSYGYDYITKLGYDKFEQRSYLKYCNGAETFYTYDNRRRLSNLAVNSGGTSIKDNAYTFDAVSNVLSVANNASLPANGNAGGQMSHTYTYDGLYRLATATGTYTGADNKSASYTLAMGYDNMHRIKSKSQHLTQDNVQFNGTLNVGYDLTYTYGSEEGKKFQLESVKDVNYRTEETPEGQQIENGHSYTYDKNGNLVYVNTNRVMTDGHRDNSVGERKLIWDEENRLLAVDDNGFVSNYWYDADGERTVKTSGESDQVYVNGVFSGGSTNTAKFSLYVSPYLVANQGGRYTKHIYAGSQRIVSKVGDFASYGSDPRRIEYAGANTDGLSVDYKSKYAAQQQVIKDNYKFFDVPYNGTDNDNYADGEGFCCNDGSMEAAVAEARKAQTRAVSRSFKDPDNYENLQFFYHSDHLGSSSFITNLDGEVVQHIEYVPFGEVFIEERNNVWNTPYLFNAKEFDEETGMYYYGARYYDPRLSLWMSTDPMEEKYPDISSYGYTYNNPIKYQDIEGLEPVKSQAGTVNGFIEFFNNTSTKMGTLKGQAAHNAMIRLSKIKIDHGVKPIPATTAPFNNQKDRYIYTEVGGWIDMSHFMFYAGRAYMHKMEKQDAQRLIQDMESKGGLALLGLSSELFKIANSSPVGEAVQEGYLQESGDKIFAKHSAYSYEDLPTDKFGADFGANYFNPNSKQSFGEQLRDYLNNVLRATDPTKAPNYDIMPEVSDRQPPSRTNHTTTPVYTKQNP